MTTFNFCGKIRDLCFCIKWTNFPSFAILSREIRAKPNADEEGGDEMGELKLNDTNLNALRDEGRKRETTRYW